jgi:protein O-GlcNAc transferase
MSASDPLVGAREALAAGNSAEAERLLRTIPEGDNRHFEALHLLGLLAHRKGQPAQAQRLLLRALELEARPGPQRGEVWSHLAEIERALGDPAAATTAARRAVELLPDWAPGYNNLGLAHLDGEKHAAAEAALRRAIELDAGYARAWYNLGNVLRLRRRPEEAEASVREALRLNPRYARAHNALGVLLDTAGRAEEAAASFQRALRLAPRDAKPLLNYGTLLSRLRRYDDALRCYDQALHLKRDYAEAWLAKASVLQSLERWDAALEAIRRAGRLRTEDAEIPFRLGQVHFSRYAYREAIAAFQKARALDPLHRGAICALAQARGEICDWRERPAEMAAIRQAIAAAKEAGEDAPVPPFVSFLPFRPDELLGLARDNAERLLRESSADRARLARRPPRPVADRRLLIGYLSSDFRSHAVAYAAQSLWGLHDRERFEIAAFSLGPDDGSDYRRRIVAECDRFVDLRSATDGEAARRIHQDGVDILVDLTGYTRGGRAGIPARRPAPVRVSWLYPCTMGGGINDYYIGDAIVTPAEHADRYGEKLVQLPHCYHITDYRQPINPRPVGRAEEGLPAEGFVFCSFNKLAKIDPTVFDCWMRILHAVPESCLWFLEWAPAREHLCREAEARGVSSRRLFFGGVRPKPDHLARHKIAQLFLDTLVFSAHTTAADALWAGVPLLTLPGETFASRVAASMLTAVGLPELVMPDLATYEQRAIELARQPDLLRAVRQQLSNRRQSAPLFDTPRFVRNLERAYLAMWARHENGLEPEMLVIEEG